MSEIAPSLATAPRQLRIWRKWALAFWAVLMQFCLHWLLLQEYEQVLGVIARLLGLCDASWFGKWRGYHESNAHRTRFARRT